MLQYLNKPIGYLQWIRNVSDFINRRKWKLRWHPCSFCVGSYWMFIIAKVSITWAPSLILSITDENENNLLLVMTNFNASLSSTFNIHNNKEKQNGLKYNGELLLIESELCFETADVIDIRLAIDISKYDKVTPLQHKYGMKFRSPNHIGINESEFKLIYSWFNSIHCSIIRTI